MQEICTMIPALANEIMWDTRGKIQQTSQSKDTVVFSFKNGSVLENVAMTENSRGRREQGVLVEECAKVDQDKLQEIVMPMMTISRQVKGQVDENELLNQSSIFVTSAGFKDSFAFQKLIQTLCEMIVRPHEAFILGGDWKIPVVEGLQPANFIQNQELDDSLEDGGFEREYGSVWSGNVVGAFFDSTLIDKHRVLNLPEYQYNKKLKGTKGYYVLGIDVGRFDDQSEVIVIKVTPTANNTWVKKVVNIITIKGQNLIQQAIELKRIFNLYECRAAVVDGNGLGAGLVDALVIDQIDPDTGDLLANWGVINDEPGADGRKRYKDFENENTIHNAMWIMKANAPLNSEMYSYCQAELRNGRLKFLIDDNQAKTKLLNQEQGKKMSPIQRAEYLKPFTETTFLKSQMTNLVQETENVNIILKQSSRKIKKDKVSALIYGLYYCKMEDSKRKKRGDRDFSKMTFFSKGVGKR